MTRQDAIQIVLRHSLMYLVEQQGGEVIIPAEKLDRHGMRLRIKVYDDMSVVFTVITDEFAETMGDVEEI